MFFHFSIFQNKKKTTHNYRSTATDFYLRYLRFLQAHKPLYVPPWYLEYLPEKFQKRTRCGYGIFNFLFGFEWFKRFRFFDLNKSTYLFGGRKRKNISLGPSIKREHYLLAIYKKSNIFNKKVFSLYFSNSLKYLFFLYKSQKLKDVLNSEFSEKKLLYFNSTVVNPLKFQSSFLYFFFQNNMFVSNLFKGTSSSISMSTSPHKLLSINNLNTRLRGALTDIFNDYSNFDIFENIIGDDEGSDAPTSHRRVFEEMYDSSFRFFFCFFLPFVFVSFFEILFLMFCLNLFFGIFHKFFYFLFLFLFSGFMDTLSFFFSDIFFLQPSWNGFLYFASTETKQALFLLFIFFLSIWFYFAVFVVFSDFFFFLRQRSDYYQGLEAHEMFWEPETTEYFDSLYENDRDVADQDTYVDKSEHEFDFLEARPTLLYYNSLIADPLPNNIYLKNQTKFAFDSVDYYEEITMRDSEEEEEDGDDFYFDVLGYHLVRPVKFAISFINHSVAWLIILPLYIFFHFFFDFFFFFICSIFNFITQCVQVFFYSQSFDNIECILYKDYMWHFWVFFFYLFIVFSALFFIFSEFNTKIVLNKSKQNANNRLSDIFEISLFKSTYAFHKDSPFWLFKRSISSQFTANVPKRIKISFIFFKYLLGSFFISQRTIENAAIWNTTLAKKWSIVMNLYIFIKKTILILIKVFLFCFAFVVLILFFIKFMSIFDYFDIFLTIFFELLLNICSFFLFESILVKDTFFYSSCFFDFCVLFNKFCLFLFYYLGLGFWFFFSVFSLYFFFIFLYFLSLFSLSGFIVYLSYIYSKVFVYSILGFISLLLFVFKMFTLFLLLLLSSLNIFKFTIVFLLHSHQFYFFCSVVFLIFLTSLFIYLFMQSLSNTFEFFFGRWIAYQINGDYSANKNSYVILTNISDKINFSDLDNADIMDYYKKKQREHKRFKLRKKSFRYQYSKYIERNVAMLSSYIKAYGWISGIVKFMLRRVRLFYYFFLNFALKLYQNQARLVSFFQRNLKKGVHIKRQVAGNRASFFDFKHKNQSVYAIREEAFLNLSILHDDSFNYVVAKQLYNSYVGETSFNSKNKPSFKTEWLSLFYLRSRWFFLWSYHTKASVIFAERTNNSVAGKTFFFLSKIDGFFDRLRFRMLVSRYFFRDEFFFKILFKDFTRARLSPLYLDANPRFKTILTRHSQDVSFLYSVKTPIFFESLLFNRQNFNFFTSYLVSKSRINLGVGRFLFYLYKSPLLSFLDTNVFISKFWEYEIAVFSKLRIAFTYKRPPLELSPQERHIAFMKSIYGENSDLFSEEDHGTPFVVYLKYNFGFFIFGVFFFKHWEGPKKSNAENVQATEDVKADGQEKSQNKPDKLRKEY